MWRPAPTFFFFFWEETCSYFVAWEVRCNILLEFVCAFHLYLHKNCSCLVVQVVSYVCVFFLQSPLAQKESHLVRSLWNSWILSEGLDLNDSNCNLFRYLMILSIHFSLLAISYMVASLLHLVFHLSILLDTKLMMCF